MRVLVIGGTGVLGRATTPRLRARGHEVQAPTRTELNLLDTAAGRRAVDGADAVIHLATRIPPRDRAGERDAWRDNDRLRAEASRILVDAALATTTEVYVQPTVAFVYPDGESVDEDTPLGDIPAALRSAIAAEEQAARFAEAGRRGVVLRLGLLDGPGTANEQPDPRFGATIHVSDAAHAVACALRVPSGIYNVCRDGERVKNDRFRQASGWRPER